MDTKNKMAEFKLNPEALQSGIYILSEVNIIDFPFYTNSNVEAARERNKAYYRSIVFPKITGRYFHYTYKNLSDYNYQILYNPLSLQTKLFNFFSVKDSPFPWIIIKK